MGQETHDRPNNTLPVGNSRPVAQASRPGASVLGGLDRQAAPWPPRRQVLP